MQTMKNANLEELSIDDNFSFDSEMYLFRDKHGEVFIGRFMSNNKHDVADGYDLDLHIVENGRDGYRSELDDIESFVLLSEII